MEMDTTTETEARDLARRISHHPDADGGLHEVALEALAEGLSTDALDRLAHSHLASLTPAQLTTWLKHLDLIEPD